MKKVFEAFPQGSAEHVLFHGVYMMRRKRGLSAAIFMKPCGPDDHRALENDRNPNGAILKAVHSVSTSKCIAVYPGYAQKVVRHVAAISHMMDLLEINKILVPRETSEEGKAALTKAFDLEPIPPPPDGY